MVQKKLVNKLSEIFLILDGDKDGYISLKAINIEVLSKEAGKILIPIFQELEMLDGGIGKIDQAEFIEASLRLYQTLPISDRSTLLNFNIQKRVFQHPDETFMPKKIATKKFDVNNYVQARYSDPDGLDASPVEMTQKSSLSQFDFVQRQMYMAEAKKAKIAAQQRAKSDVEVADCTFQP